MAGRRPLTLRRAIVLTVVLGLLVPALLISGYTSIRRYIEGIERESATLLHQHANILATGMQEPLWHINTESGNALVAAIMARNEDIVRVEVRDNALGLFVSGKRAAAEDAASAQTELPVLYRGTVIGSVLVEVSSARLREEMEADLVASLASLLAQAALSIILILVLLERRLLRPLKLLGKGAERLAKRELEVPFSWERQDEIGMLGQRLEDTRLSLRQLFAELDRKNRELERDIDRRKHIEKELHERENRYRALVQQSPIAIIEWDGRLRVAQWNNAAEDIFGYRRKHAVGRHAGFLTEPGPDGLSERLSQWLKEGSGSRHVATCRRADGRIIYCQWRHTRIADEAGGPDRLLSIAEDITEKRRAEEALSLSEAKFANAFQSNPDAIALTRMADDVLMDVNQSFSHLTGYSRREAVGATALALGLWAHPAQRQGLVQQLAGQRLVRNYEWSMRTRQGSLRQCTTNASILHIHHERYVLTVFRDVTDQRLLEAQKAEADRVLLRLAQGTRDIAGAAFFDLLVADLASALRTECAYIGLRPPGATVISTIAAHMRAAGVPNFTYAIKGTPCARALDGGMVLLPRGAAYSFPAGTALGNRTWQAYAAAPLRDAAGNTIGVLAVMDSEELGNPDLVRSLLQVFSERASAELERTRSEREIRDLNAHLEQRVATRTEELQQANRDLAATLETLRLAQEELVRSEKLAALGSLVAGVAHELNTPLGNSLMVASTLIDHTRTLSRQYQANELKRSVLASYLADADTAGEILMRNLQRAADLVTGFKQVAVDQATSQRRKFSVSAVVSEIILTLSPTLKKTAFVVHQHIPSTLRMDSYPGPLGQVVANLVTNALLHAFEGRQAGTVTIGASAVHGWLELTVCDDGNGIGPAAAPRIFDPYFTTKLGAGGSGLGLHIAHNIVTGILGGRIRVQSEVGRGTSFILNLPMQAPTRQNEDQALIPPG